jgi:hypothetical protein
LFIEIKLIDEGEIKSKFDEIKIALVAALKIENKQVFQ